jgi:predicted  nucleic acid-binding Zn-ribbon protein
MVRNRFLLGSFAFGISFGISLLTTRDINRALVTGLTTLPATVIAALMVDHRLQAQTSRRIAFLKNQIRTLQKQRAEAVEALQTLQASEPVSLSADAASPVEPPPRQLPPVPVAVSRKPLSWDLSAPVQPRAVIEVHPHELPTEVQILPPEEGERVAHPSRLEMEKVLAEATATRQKIEANVRSLQTELNQLQSRVEQQRQSREQLVKELADLERQKRKLQTESSGLQKDVDQLKRRQQELDQYITQAEAKKQEIETGAHPLRTAMQQMQAQISSLQNELGRLENQVSDRQRQKVDLEQQLATLRNQLSNLQSQTTYSSPATNGISNGHGNPAPNRPAEKAKLIEKPKSPSKLTPEPVRPVASAESLPSPSPTQTTTAVAEPSRADKTADLEEGWEEFMLSLPEYEFLVLKAIAEQSNPAGFIKKIAEDNLTMPELLIDSINERALDTVGDMVIEPGNGAGTATIARDHTKTIKKLIKTYEYLTE